MQNGELNVISAAEHGRCWRRKRDLASLTSQPFCRARSRRAHVGDSNDAHTLQTH